MPQYLVVPYPYDRSLGRLFDGVVNADNSQKAAEQRPFRGHLVKVVNLDEAEIFKSETTCTTVVTKVDE